MTQKISVCGVIPKTNFNEKQEVLNMSRLFTFIALLVIGLTLSVPIGAETVTAVGTDKIMIASSDQQIVQGKPMDSSLLDVQRKEKLFVGVDIPYGVMEFYDKSGKPAGIDIEIANEIASHIGVSMELKKMPFSKLFGTLKDGEVDVIISAVTITAERQEKMLFSVPYLDAGVSIAVRKDDMEIKSIEDLEGKKVGVLKGTIAEQLVAKSEYIDSSLVKSYEKNDKRLQDLSDGELDAIVVHFLVKDLPSVKLVGEPLSQSYYGVVTKLNNNALMDEINKTLRDLKRSDKLRKIKQKYVNAETQ
ncbi:MAG: amino acid ABC transporter substrate-binding protein [Proteobacteria bacterium]|nr:amino acid ABC transporter substrate-binding protein [Pseudomonadota bacterium]